MRVLALVVEARAQDRVPTVLRLCLADEIQLFDGAQETLGPEAAAAADAGPDCWRGFLEGWLHDRAGLRVVFDARETTVE
jgi:hypothetical protein